MTACACPDCDPWMQVLPNSLTPSATSVGGEAADVVSSGVRAQLRECEANIAALTLIVDRLLTEAKANADRITQLEQYAQRTILAPYMGTCT